MGFINYCYSVRGRRLHRRVSGFVAIYVIMAALSGIIHIVMTNFFAPPPPVFPQGSVDTGKIRVSPGEVVQKLPGSPDTVKSIAVRQALGKLWYQIVTEDAPLPFYVDVESGVLASGADMAYAKDIAKIYLKTEKPLLKTAYLTAFEGEYLNIFRVLPVYRFDLEDGSGTRVYVSTLTGSVTLHLNSARAFGQKAFSYLHKLSFIPNKAVRDALQALLVLAIA